jgi:thymidylate synthase
VITIVVRNSNNGKYANGDIFVEEDSITLPSYSENPFGVPFNISSYALLTHLIAHVCGLEVGEFVYTLGDYHIYQNHKEQVEELLSREPLALPRLEIKKETKRLRGLQGLLDMRYEDIALVGYESHAKIAAPVAI